jgi:hypothetical protein
MNRTRSEEKEKCFQKSSRETFCLFFLFSFFSLEVAALANDQLITSASYPLVTQKPQGEDKPLQYQERIPDPGTTKPSDDSRSDKYHNGTG